MCVRNETSVQLHVVDDTANFFKCSMKTCKLTSSVSTGAPSCKSNIGKFFALRLKHLYTTRQHTGCCLKNPLREWVDFEENFRALVRVKSVWGGKSSTSSQPVLFCAPI
jgi:hypothetical protein